MEETSELRAITDSEDIVGDDDTALQPLDGELSRLDRIIESVLFAAAQPVSLRRLVDVLDGPTTKEVHGALARLLRYYGPGQRGIQLYEVAGGYQFRTARENAEWVRAVFRDKPARLGRAALETLAIIAYKQPTTRAEVEVVRGVDVDGVVSTLLSRRLIKISGRKEAVGRPLLYSTTTEFLETFGLKDLNELPSLKELGPAPDADDGQTVPEAREQAPSATATSEQPATAQSAREELAAEPSEAVVADAAADDGGALAEDSEPGGDRLAAEGGGADHSGSGADERAGGDPTGDEGESTDGSDHD
ncbi:MAG TPA: SMC-Scp complex subunit ScpB [Candidatus Acidoferrales bacterium]|nr:SMC-Scp complex subunit ScpB [Candidatus Acidoferrales bacterium]